MYSVSTCLQSSDAPDVEFNYDDADDHLSEIAGEFISLILNLLIVQWCKQLSDAFFCSQF